MNQIGESDFFSEDYFMGNYRFLRVAIFHGFAFWRDTGGQIYRVDCIDDATGKVKLPKIGNGLVWENNVFSGAADAFLEGRIQYHPYGTQPGDEALIPWNRWLALSDTEKAAKYTLL